MKSIELKAHAKINLSLDVIRKREDGYHDLKMIMQTIDLCDILNIDIIEKGIEITSNNRWIPLNQDNIAYKAAKLIIDEYNIQAGVKIKIQKNIPIAAGLAGGSSNAAAVLKGMNTMFDLNIPESRLMELGKCIGADVPFCIKGGTMLAEGIGDILTDLGDFEGIYLVLIKPKIGVSSAYVYKNLCLDKVNERPSTDKLIEQLKNKNIEFIASNMKNVLETVTIPKHDIIREIKNKLIKAGALGSMMSGSGPTVFGIFKDKPTQQNAFKSLKNNLWECFETKTVNREML